MLLMIAAFRQVPAGSLPDDDMLLSDVVGMSDGEWADAKAAVMREWTLCADGRWHHLVAATIAEDAWSKKLANKERTEKATAKRQANRDVRRDDSRDVQRDVQRHVNVTECNKGEEGEERDQVRTSKNEARIASAAADSAFDVFWKAYPHKVGRPPAKRAFQAALKRLGNDVERIMTGLEAYKASKPQDRHWCNPSTFLNGDRFDDQPAVQIEAAEKAPTTHWQAGVSEAAWRWARGDVELAKKYQNGRAG